MQIFILAVVAILLVILFVWLLLREQGERTAVEPVAGKKLAEVETEARRPTAAEPAVKQVVVEPAHIPTPVVAVQPAAAEPAAAEPVAAEPAVTEPAVTEVPPAAVETPAPVIAAAPPVIDDLEIIEGIGPKIAGVLKQAGITSFAQLAEVDPARISEILHAANLRLADPKTWPPQARLAAAGDQAGLKALQDRLKGGREV